MTHRLLAVIAAGALVASLGACATNVSTPESVRGGGASAAQSATGFDAVKSAVSFEDDPHMGTRSAISPEISYLDPERNKFLDGYNIYHIRAFDIGRSGAEVVDFTEIQIRVRQSTNADWPQYNSAFSEGQSYDLRPIDSEVSCINVSCLKTELVGIDLTMPELRELSDRSILTFKIVGKRNSMIIEIPQSYLRGFLAAVDEREGM